jgi:hypothetical protein
MGGYVLDTTRATMKTTRSTILLSLRVYYFTAVTFIPSRCLAKMDGYTSFDTTQATLKTTRPTILLQLRVSSLPR